MVYRFHLLVMNPLSGGVWGVFSNDSHYIPIDLISFFMILPKRLTLRENIDSPFSIPSRLMFSAQSCIGGPLGRTSLIGTFILGLDLFGGFLLCFFG